jgi:potassium voltage-gated channel Shaw-related subfamily C protein
MTYTQHRDTQETLQVIENIDNDSTEPLSAEEIAKKFGFEDDFYSGTVTAWQRLKPKVWSLFDEPWSSQGARVSFWQFWIVFGCLNYFQHVLN